MPLNWLGRNAVFTELKNVTLAGKCEFCIFVKICSAMSDLIKEISKISVADRIALVQAILQTISGETEPSSESSLTDVQLSEIEARSASIASGEAATISWERIQAKLKQRYGL